MSNQGNQTDTADRQLLLLINILMVGAIALSGWLLFLTFFGYGTLQIQNIPSNSSVSINGHTIVTKKVTLRAGTYQLLISSPFINPYEATITIGVQRTNVLVPQLSRRNPNAIASTLIGSALGQQTPPQVNSVKWFDDNTWVVGVLAASGNPVIAMHFDDSQQWHIAYYDAADYPHNQATLPPEILVFVKDLRAHYVAG